ncbi:MAG: M48 family metalloprotease [Sphingobium sp.]
MKKLRFVGGCAVLAAVSFAGQSAISKQKEIPLATSISSKDRADGAKAHPDLLKEFGGAYQGSQASYAIGVGRKIASQSSLSSSQGDFTVTLLNSSVNNAFAIPGGYVYITRQLMALCNDEAEMAGVLGHEVGHVAAQHSQRRQAAATRTAIGGLLLQVLTGAVLGNTGLGSLLQKGIGSGSQLLTLKFSRAQEYEADDLGIRYLAKAGYDPKALSSMLGSLAAQSALDARLAGRAESMPEWASTHPDPASRVTRALQNARATGVTSNYRNRDVFLNALNGVTYGDDPAQGVIEGSRFLHPGMKIGFTAPTGYGMSNGTDAVSITGSGGQGQFTGAAYNGNLESYVQSVFSALANNGSLAGAQVRRTTINGLPAAYATMRANTQSGQTDVTVFAYEMGPQSAFHFVLLTPAGQGVGPFASLVQSFHTLSAQEAAGVKARKIAVVSAKVGDTVASMAARMAYTDYKQERFLTLNGLSATSRLAAGQRVKLVTY